MCLNYLFDEDLAIWTHEKLIIRSLIYTSVSMRVYTQVTISNSHSGPHTSSAKP